MNQPIPIETVTYTPAQQALFMTLMMADNALIHSHRLSEWCGHGPVLEQDIAMTNMALDHLGHARALYQYAAEQYNALTQEEKNTAFTSPLINALTAAAQPLKEDDVPYLRDAWDYRNVLLVELPNHDFGYTIVRSFFFDVFNYFYYKALQNHPNALWRAVAEKAIKEVAYHVKWSSEWVIRLGDGTDESHQRVQQAVNDTWMYTGELFTINDTMKATGVAEYMPNIKEQWHWRVAEIMTTATLKLPDNNWMQSGGKEGVHSEHLGYILADMQFMQRTYPGLNW